MNGQIVLCKGINDGKELERSISDLTGYLPYLQSVSVVPVGLSKYREGLFPLESFEKEDAVKVLDCIHSWQNKIYNKTGTHFIHASDEWYILAEQELPEEERYDGYLQLENGVGMLRLMINEFNDAMSDIMKDDRIPDSPVKRKISIATGKLVYPYIVKMADELQKRFSELEIFVYAIENRFFGEKITVSGLLTGQDLGNQLKNRNLGECLLLPDNVLRCGEKVFLDDITLKELSDTLQVPIDIVKSSGYDFVAKVLGVEIRGPEKE